MRYAPSHLSGTNESEYFQSYAQDPETAWIAEVERVNLQGISANDDVLVLARGLARFAADRGLPFPLPVEFQNLTHPQPTAFGGSKMVKLSNADLYLLVKQKLGLKTKTKADVVKALREWPKKWPALAEAKEASDRAIAIEGTLAMKEMIEESKAKADTVSRFAKLLFKAMGLDVASVVFAKIYKLVGDGFDLTIDLIEGQKAAAEPAYAAARMKHEAAINQMRKQLEDKNREARERVQKAQASRGLSRWLVVGAGVAVGAAVTFYLWRGRKG